MNIPRLFRYNYLVQQTSDSGYILVGRTKSSGAGNHDVCLIRTDDNGNKLWDNIFGGYGDDEVYSIQQTSDGGYILAGSAEYYGAWLIKISSQGRKEWDTTYGSEFGNADFVHQTSDGGYIVAGFTDNGFTSPSNAWQIKTDSQGSKRQDIVFKGLKVDSGRSIQQTSEGGYVIVGDIYIHSSTSSIVGSIISLTKADSEGIVQWNKTFGGVGYNNACSIQQTTDSGYILTAHNEYGIWLIKTDSEGN